MLRVALCCELLYVASCSMVRVALCCELLYVASCPMVRVALCGELPYGASCQGFVWQEALGENAFLKQQRLCLARTSWRERHSEATEALFGEKL